MGATPGQGPGPACRLRPMGLLAAVPLLLAALLATPAQAAALPGFRAVAEAGAGSAALHGSHLVWVAPDGYLQLLDLRQGSTRPLTFLPPGVQVQSLSFDGQWVAWSDNRFGDYEVFAMDVDALALVRLSHTPAKDVEVTVGGGHAAWLRNGVLVGTDLEAPDRDPPRLSPFPGLVFTPAMDGNLLVWSQAAGTVRQIAALAWGQEAVLLTDGPDFKTEPAVSENRIAWRSESFTSPPGTPGSRSLGYRIQVGEFQDGRLAGLRNVTERGSHGAPRLGGSWLAWPDAPKGIQSMQAIHLDSGESYPLSAPLQRFLVSDTHLVVESPPGTPLQGRAWSGGKNVPAPWLAVPAVLLGAAFQVLRRRTQA